MMIRWTRGGAGIVAMSVQVLWEFCERPGFGHDYRFRDLHRERKTLLLKGDPDYARGGLWAGHRCNFNPRSGGVPGTSRFADEELSRGILTPFLAA